MYPAKWYGPSFFLLNEWSVTSSSAQPFFFWLLKMRWIICPFAYHKICFLKKRLISKDWQTFRKGIKIGCIKNPWPELKWKKKYPECQIEMWVRLAGLCYFVHAAVSQATSWFITHRLSYEHDLSSHVPGTVPGTGTFPERGTTFMKDFYTKSFPERSRSHSRSRSGMRNVAMFHVHEHDTRCAFNWPLGPQFTESLHLILAFLSWK